jgi:6-phosphogluconolactonase
VRPLEIHPDSHALVRAAAEYTRRAAEAAVSERGRFRLVLSGGATPRALYSLLSKSSSFPWQHTDVFFGDERAVPPGHPDSNARMVRDTLLRTGLVPPDHVHRIRAELRPKQAASDYERTLRKFFPDAAEFPRFDLVLLGLGSDGHTASLFPSSSVIAERTKWVAAAWVEKLGAYRITLTLPTLNAAASVLFLVSGAEKAGALKAALNPSSDVNLVPAAGVHPRDGELRYLIDREAATALGAVAGSD